MIYKLEKKINKKMEEQITINKDKQKNEKKKILIQQKKVSFCILFPI